MTATAPVKQEPPTKVKLPHSSIFYEINTDSDLRLIEENKEEEFKR